MLIGFLYMTNQKGMKKFQSLKIKNIVDVVKK